MRSARVRQASTGRGATATAWPGPGIRRLGTSLVLHSRALEITAAVAFCVLVWILRRPEQLLHPYVWTEEKIVLIRFVHDGWKSAVLPVNGYLILPTSMLISLSAA